jgi:hypothetical protein
MSVRAPERTVRDGRIAYEASDAMGLPWEAVELLSPKLCRSLDGSISCYAVNPMVCWGLHSWAQGDASY